jgi:hypothetical protein
VDCVVLKKSSEIKIEYRDIPKHSCVHCRGIYYLYKYFRSDSIHFIESSIEVTRGVNKGSKAISFQRLGNIRIESLYRKTDSQ